MSTNAKQAFSERHFTALAEAIDRVPPAQRELFLAKLVVLLSASLGDPAQLELDIQRAMQHFPGDDR